VQQQRALALVRAPAVIYHEDVQTLDRLKRHHRARRSSDAGWAAVPSTLSVKAAYAAACAGRTGRAVPPAFMSQMCSGCGVIVSNGVSVRWHECAECGASLQRDHNAAKLLARAGQTRRGAVA
jgi:putative transposase